MPPRTANLMIRMTPDQKREVQRRADLWGMTLSEFVRHMLLARPKQPKGAQ